MRHSTILGIITSAAAWFTLTAAAGPTRASETTDSYWGPIPAQPDSGGTTLEDDGRPAWEHVVNAPYWIVTAPVQLLFQGGEQVVEFVDENPTMRRLVRLFPLAVGPALVTPGGSAGGGEGFGFSLSLDVPRLFAEGRRLKFRGAASTRGRSKATLGIDWPRGEDGQVEFGAGYRSDRQARFFGLGPDSDEVRRSRYHHELSWIGLSYGRRLPRGFVWEIGTLYSGVSAITNSLDSATDRSLSREFAPELASGTDAGRAFAGFRELSQGVSVHLEVSHDDTHVAGRPWVGRPERGGLRRVKVAWFQGKSTDIAEFMTYRAEAQQFFPLWFSKRALALRAYVSWIDRIGDEPVPFQRMLTNDDPDLFRGYEDERFRDLGIGAASVEYRWPVWATDGVDGIGADAYLFTDWGQVFEKPSDLHRDDLRQSYGGGLRIAAGPAFLGRLEFGRSDEGWIVRLRADQIFQFGKGGLYAGRPPVPAR